MEVVLATARSPRSTRVIACEAGLTGIAVCANGAIVYDLDADRIVDAPATRRRDRPPARLRPP